VQSLDTENDWKAVDVNIWSLLNALYAISAVLITFGAVIGKVTPLQLLIITIIEIFLHGVNYKCILGKIGVFDLGGTYIDHMFGAYFGLGVAYMLGAPKATPQMGHTPDVFSLIGTVFLWIYWPSFVAGAATPNSDQQQIAIVNTILALASSTVTAFAVSSFMGEKGLFRPVDIQNATLAGGVAIGVVSDMGLKPAGSIAVGSAAAIVSTWGFNRCQEYLEKSWGLHDSCGVHNLHAMPSIVGAIASIIVTAYLGGTDTTLYDSNNSDPSDPIDAKKQWSKQLLGMLAVVGFSIITGVITGYICNLFKPEENSVNDFQDNEWWEVADDYGTGVWSELGAVLGDDAAKDLADLDSSYHKGRGRDGEMDANSTSVVPAPSGVTGSAADVAVNNKL
jgi:ammonium transporter Rh